jgi:alpha-L-rhamnosidase
MAELELSNVKVEYRSNWLGAGVRRPRFSWEIRSDRRGTKQSAYRIQVAGPDGDFGKPLWDTGRTESEQSIHVVYAGPELASRTRSYFRVKVWDNYGRESAWSEPSWWETGLLDPSEWKAQWITPDPEAIDPLAEPAFMLRKRFELKGGIVSARIYATGIGLYELHLNGQRVGDEWLTPGWTSYKKRLQYQTYDVTDMLREGANGIGIMLADGWYKGNLAFEGKRHIYGDRRAALLQLHVQHEDGTETVVVTDPSWKASTGPILYSELYHGEVYDARLEVPGWSEADFDDGGWAGTTRLDLPVSHLTAQENWPTRVTETIRPIAALTTPQGDLVLDMGQNMVGRIRFSVDAPAGAKIVLHHAEVLDKDGNFYTGNLRKARQTIEYIAKGEGTETYAPHFTFQGFRYVRVQGYPGAEAGLPLDRFIGEVMHSDMEPTGEFTCSDPLVNQLQRNIVWGQRGNFVDVPTDCPQRDERLGWTGDAQVFVGTAIFNYQTAPFFTKWLRDLRADQLPDGGVPFVIPDVLGGASSAAWGDAATIIPWAVYRNYGDKELLAEQYDSMKAWVEYIRAQGDNEYLWNTGFHFGDWLALDAKENSYVGATPRDLIATAYYAYSTRIVRDAAVVLGKQEDAEKYGRLLERVVDAFCDEFVTPNGRLASPTQTAHVLALAFDLVRGEKRERIARMLNELVRDNEYHLSTGFVGTPYLCFALSQSGYHDTAVRLLLQKSYPSWLYPVTKGATTIWEHWDSIKPDGSFWSDDMNSFNHYAYGAIGEWMYKIVAGLDQDESETAYRRIRIAPHFGRGELKQARASYKSMYGRIVSAWTLTEEQAVVEVEIPANTTAEVHLPGARLAETLEGGQPLQAGDGIAAPVETESGLKLTLGSGRYRFVYPRPDQTYLTFDENTRIGDMLEVEAARKVLESHLPHLQQARRFILNMSLAQMAGHPQSQLTPDKLQQIVAELKAIRI